jgi:hypothetical protein
MNRPIIRPLSLPVQALIRPSDRVLVSLLTIKSLPKMNFEMESASSAEDSA